MENISTNFANFNTSSTMWIWFIPAALITLYAAMRMVNYAELIIQKTKLGGAFVGLVLVSMITSIPELLTEISQGLNNTPGIGIADDIGANAFSTFMLAIATLIFIRSMFIKKLGLWTKVSIIISFVLTVAMTIILYFNKDIALGENGKFIMGIIPIAFILAYFIFVYFSYKFRHLADEEPDNDTKSRFGILGISLMFTMFSIILIGSSLFLNWTVDAMQETYNISHQSAGGIFLSMTTAMPEVVALFQLARKGYLTAATGAIIGSHIFNISCLFWGDMSYSGGALLENAEAGNVWTIALVTSIEIALLLVFVAFGKKLNTKLKYAIIPSMMIATYIIGWSLILFIK